MRRFLFQGLSDATERRLVLLVVSSASLLAEQLSHQALLAQSQAL
jgi:hypothetical protein